MTSIANQRAINLQQMLDANIITERTPEMDKLAPFLTRPDQIKLASIRKREDPLPI